MMKTLALASAVGTLISLGGARADEAHDDHCTVAVVGGGWGGAYFAYRLCIDSDAYTCDQICVFEANDRLGGRVYSTPLEIDPDIKIDVGPYRYRISGAPTSSGAEEIIQGVIEDALALPFTGYTNPTDSTYRVVSDPLGNNAGFNVPIYRMIELIEDQGARIFFGARVSGVYRSPAGSAHPTIVRFATGDLSSVTADLAFLNTPWAAVNNMSPDSALFQDTNATARQCVEMITSSSVSAKYYVQYDDAWWVTKLGLTEGTFSDNTAPRLAGRYHDGPLWCVDTVARKRGRDGQLTKAQVLKKVAGGKKSELECSGTLLATYVFSNAGFWLDYQANISDAKTKQEWVVDQSSSVSVASSRPSAAERIRRLQLRGDTSLQPHKPGRRDPAELLQDYHTKLMQFHADALEAAGYSPDDIEPPRWGYQGNWNSYTALDAISATSPGSGSWPSIRPEGLTRPEVLRYLYKPVADLPILMANVDWGMYGGWAEGSLVSVERVLAFHVGLPKPEWLSQEYYDDTVLQMDVSKERQAAYDAQHVE